MGVKGRSAKGQVVDFDLLKIKEQMTTDPVPIDVKQRQDFVERRLKRRTKKKMEEVNVEPTLPSPDETVPENAPDETFIEPEANVEEVKEEPKPKTRKKQPGRRKKTTEENANESESST